MPATTSTTSAEFDARPDQRRHTVTLADCVGGTPLVELQRMRPSSARLLAKL